MSGGVAVDNTGTEEPKGEGRNAQTDVRLGGSGFKVEVNPGHQEHAAIRDGRSRPSYL